ncbi:MAG: lactate utilization protein [Acidimicrobiia bacterium]
MNRDAFLARVSAGVLKAELPPAPLVAPYTRAEDEGDMVELFRNRAQLINTVVHGPMPRHSVPRAVAGVAAGHDIETYTTWDDLPAPGVASALSVEGWSRIKSRGEDDDHFGRTPVAGADFGVTGSSAGLAESGSVVLRHHSGRSRLISALPLIHVALLRVETIYRSLADWARAYPDAVEGTANLVIVTGPSRTGDIEQHLNLGVHGPKHLHVVLIK